MALEQAATGIHDGAGRGATCGLAQLLDTGQQAGATVGATAATAGDVWSECSCMLA